MWCNYVKYAVALATIQLALVGTTTKARLLKMDDGNRCASLKPLDYELFSSKTMYEAARAELARLSRDELPATFSEKNLEQVHNELSQKGCEPNMLFFFGRHTARFPNKEDIPNYERDFDQLLERMRSQVSADCQQKRAEFLKWKPTMGVEHHMLATRLGLREERDIAKRFKRLYPELFSSQTTQVSVGVTSRVRTAQTALEFLREVDGYKLPEDCEPASVPTDDRQPDYNTVEVNSNQCYKYLTSRYENHGLTFHKWNREKTRDPILKLLKDPILKKPIADRLAQKLGLDNDLNPPPISPDMVDSIFDMCRFENARFQKSLWCDLFERRDVEAIEYIEDAISYHKNSDSRDMSSKIPCPLLRQLTRAVRGAAYEGANNEAYLMFTHEGAIKQLMGTFGLFEDDENYSLGALKEFKRSQKVPAHRNYRTSLFGAFSTNLAFVNYKCPSSRGGEPEYKLLTSLNEQPIKLAGCDKLVCDVDQFAARYHEMCFEWVS